MDARLTLAWPRAGQAIWEAFCGMGRATGMGPSPLTCTEIDAWQRLHGVRLTSWELEMIRVFDGLALEAARKAQK